jgi:pimeloyl-ACP methyl ester carboxylesterase
MPGLVEHLMALSLKLRGYRSARIATREGTMHALAATGRGVLPTAVFLHGVSASSVELAGVFTRVRPHVSRVVAVDLPGHGFSVRPRAGMRGEAILDAATETIDGLLGPGERAVLFGNSLGGACAVRFANARPERVAGLVLSSPGAAGMSEEELATFLRTFPDGSQPSVRDFVDRLYLRPPPFRSLVEREVARRFRSAPITELIRNVTTDDLLRPEELSRIDAPVLLLWGKADRVQPPAQLEFFRRHLPAHARVEEPDDYTHCPYLERALDVADRFLAFARALEPPSPERMGHRAR